MTNVRNETKRFSWLEGAGALLSLLACYGTLGIIALLSLAGISLSLNLHVWAAAIVAFALIAVLGVALGYRQHRILAPVLLAVVGALLVMVAMYGSELIRAWFGLLSSLFEIAGFAGLILAAIWDWRLKKTTG